MRQYRLADGRLVEFDSDLVCQCLFELTEESGHPDVFLARELTDGLLYLLSTEAGDEIPDASELAELIEKYLRELGRPILAKQLSHRWAAKPAAFAVAARSESPANFGQFQGLEPVPDPATLRSRFSDAKLEEFSLAHIYPRDVVSMHRDGLLTLFGLSRPFELAGSVLGPAASNGVAGQIDAARYHSGQFLAIDGADFALATATGPPAELAAQYASTIRSAIDRSGIAICLNLNQQAPPPALSGWAGGSLFSEFQSEPECGRIEEVGAALARELADQSTGSQSCVEIFWHLSGRDFQPENAARSLAIVRLASTNSRLTFVFDRARYGVSLAAGLTREKPAALMAVGIQLHRLAQQIPGCSLELFLKKLGSLARLARSTGHAKFDFLRKHARPEARGGFLLERARLLVVPIGLEAAVRMLSNCPISDDGPGGETAKAIVQRLRQALDQEPPRNIEVCVDSLPWLTDRAQNAESESEALIDGLTPWDAESLPRMQIKAAGSLHSLAAAGTAHIRIPPDNPVSAEELVGLLRSAWFQTEVHRLKFHLEAGK